MNVVVNGEPREVPPGLTVTALLAHLAIEGRVAVEINREIVPRARHGEHVVVDGDALEIVYFVGGG